MELLRFLTCGSVDDGKSTLIGRMLHDANLIHDDQLAAVRDNLALLVDGLKAEREQGITIDVAWRYVSTPRRKFIIADTPGHEELTRNMATGASRCDLAVILVDATRGPTGQTRRHAFIAALLGIRHLVVAVNKMDLAGYAEDVFRRICDDFTGFAAKLQITDVRFIPMVARDGDNVVHASAKMTWYAGGPLLAWLESVHIAGDRNLIDLRLPVQLVVRHGELRGYAGSIASGVLRKGDEVIVLPSLRRSRIRSILAPDGERDEAFAPMPVMVTLEDDLDAERGDMLVQPNNLPQLANELEAMVVWMDDAPSAERRLVLKQTTAGIPGAAIRSVRYRINVDTLHREACAELRLNDVGRVRIETPRTLAFDAYDRNRVTGAFILIDETTNATVAAGMILDRRVAESLPEQRDR